MSTKNQIDVKQFLNIHGALTRELADVRQQISTLREREVELAEALEGRSVNPPAKKTVNKQRQERVQKVVAQGASNQLLEFIEKNPGVSGSAIREHFKGTFPESTVERALANTRKRKLIVNQGSTRSSRWHIVKKP